MKLGTPILRTPGPQVHELGDLGPQINIILGTPGALFSYGIGDPLMKMETFHTIVKINQVSITRVTVTIILTSYSVQSGQFQLKLRLVVEL